MGNIFSICTNKNQIVSTKQIRVNNAEYKSLQIEDKIYILFENKEKVDYIEI